MSTTRDSTRALNPWWYAYHLMAALSAVLLIAGLIGLALVISDKEAVLAALRNSTETFRVLSPLFVACLISAFWLLAAMAGDYISHRSNRPSRWGLLLVLFNWGAAIAYFLLVWRPTHSRGGT